MPLVGVLNGLITIQINFPGGGNENFSIPFTNLSSPGGAPVTDLVSGDNVFAYPATAIGALFVPPASNNLALAIRNAAAGNGPALSANLPNVITRSGSQANLVINSGGTIAGCLLYFL